MVKRQKGKVERLKLDDEDRLALIIVIINASSPAAWRIRLARGDGIQCRGHGTGPEYHTIITENLKKKKNNRDSHSDAVEE